MKKADHPINPSAGEVKHNAPAEQRIDFDGKKYRLASAHQKEWGAQVIAELPFKGTEPILDLGCGDGALTVELACRVPHGSVVGIDSSPSMISAASEQTRPNLSFRLLDINQIEFESKFDVIFSNSALHWVRDHQNLWSRVLQALRPGGTIRFNFPAKGNSATFQRIAREVMELPQYAPAFRDFEWPWYMPTPEEYGALVSRFPLHELDVYGENRDRYFPDVESMIRWIDQPCLPPFLSRLPNADHNGFRAEVTERMVEAARQPDGRCFEQFRRVEVFARR